MPHFLIKLRQEWGYTTKENETFIPISGGRLDDYQDRNWMTTMVDHGGMNDVTKTRKQPSIKPPAATNFFVKSKLEQDEGTDSIIILSLTLIHYQVSIDF
uniref:Uncharacterized protein n=1 Tax=Magallana gigas TaxID=29159 RepID=K1Q6S3_MAGGI